MIELAGFAFIAGMLAICGALGFLIVSLIRLGSIRRKADAEAEKSARVHGPHCVLVAFPGMSGECDCGADFMPEKMRDRLAELPGARPVRGRR